jgi:hypothetical protein
MNLEGSRGFFGKFQGLKCRIEGLGADLYIGSEF